MIDGFTYKNTLSKVVDRMENELISTEYKQKFMEFKKDFKVINEREKIYIVFVGEYSTGKSSVIKALTEDENIEIGDIPTTNKENIYDYNGYCVVDTPGLYSGNNIHDKIAHDSYEKADAIVFCISANNLFTNGSDETNGSLKKFIEIYQKYNNRMILCVTKIDLETSENINDYLGNIEDDILDILMENNIEFSNIVQISAQKYLNSLNCNENERRHKQQASRFNKLIDNLNLIGKENDIDKKCLKLIKLIYRFIESIEDSEKTKENRSKTEKENKKIETKRIERQLNDRLFKFQSWSEEQKNRKRETIRQLIKDETQFDEVNSRFKEDMVKYSKECEDKIKELYEEWIEDKTLFTVKQKEKLINDIHNKTPHYDALVNNVKKSKKIKGKPGQFVEPFMDFSKKCAKTIKFPESKRDTTFFGLFKKSVKSPELNNVQKIAKFMLENTRKIDVAASVISIGLDVSLDVWNSKIEKNNQKLIRDIDNQVQEKMNAIDELYKDYASYVYAEIIHKVSEKNNFCDNSSILKAIYNIKMDVDVIYGKIGENNGKK